MTESIELQQDSATVSGSKRPTLEILKPNATLYISNIDWSIKKAVLRRSLHALFGRHGKILDIVTLRREGLRGQAWVIFADVAAATAALQAENGFTFFGRDLKVAYAREKSDRVSKLDGTYVPKDRRAKKRAKLEAVAPPPSASVENPSSLVGQGDPMQHVPPPPPPPSEAIPADSEAVAAPPDASAPPILPVAAEAEIPSKILFAQDLPAECNEMMLAMLFRQHSGYKEVRIPRPGLAFVEFEDEPHATLALKALNGFKLTTTETLNLKYGKA